MILNGSALFHLRKVEEEKDMGKIKTDGVGAPPVMLSLTLLHGVCGSISDGDGQGLLALSGLAGRYQLAIGDADVLPVVDILSVNYPVRMVNVVRFDCIGLGILSPCYGHFRDN